MNDLYIPDCLFPTDNELEIPTLLIERQASVCEIPFVCYGEQKRTFNMQGTGTLHFYTDDYRFNAVYEHPERILQHHPANIVEPNFSLFNETPIAFGMQAVYKKRFIARAMQEKGINVFVDLNVAPKFYKINMVGIPRGWRSFCTRGYSDRLNHLAFELEMAKFIANGEPVTFVVYGGGELCKDFCRKNNCIYVTPVIAMKNKLKSLEKFKDSIAFFGQDISSVCLLQTKDEMFNKQIEDFSKSTSLP